MSQNHQASEGRSCWLDAHEDTKYPSGNAAQRGQLKPVGNDRREQRHRGGRDEQRGPSHHTEGTADAEREGDKRSHRERYSEPLRASDRLAQVGAGQDVRGPAQPGQKRQHQAGDGHHSSGVVAEKGDATGSQQSPGQVDQPASLGQGHE